jgi:CspA family cold shock protein
MATGTVKWFNAAKGFEFIQPDAGGADVFVHIGALERAGLRGLYEEVAYEIVANKRPGKSSAEFEAGLNLPVTYHVVVAFDRDEEGELKPREAQEVMSPIVAERRARALALEHAGALAFSRTGNPATGEFGDAVILARFGEVDLDSLGE